MVAVIKTGYSLRRVVHYNENKVKEGVAEALFAGNYPMEMEEMSLNQRLNLLLKQAALNEHVRRNSVHISLNFAPGEDLGTEVLKQIATEYMEQIGFGDQPFLVYRHNDAGHPHIHIVSLKVRANGRRIDTQYIGLNQSEVARKAIEKKHGLVEAEAHKRAQFKLKPVDVARVVYGRTPTKRAIGAVLESVLDRYRYASLAELNAVLMQYNVLAERGAEDSVIYKNNGLVYRVLDADRNPVGVPIKASDFYNRPTLSYIGERFSGNEKEKQKHKNELRNTIDKILQSPKKLRLEWFIDRLQKSGVATVLRQNEAGLIYGITFVDHRSRCVFNGRTLGANYSAAAMHERCIVGAQDKGNTLKDGGEWPDHSLERGLDKMFDALLLQDDTSENMPFELRAKRKKRKKKS